MPRRLLVTTLLAACGPSLTPAEIGPQRPWVAIAVDTAVSGGGPTDLPAGTSEFRLSTSSAFDHTCVLGPKGLVLGTRADAAPTVGLALGPWPDDGSGTLTFACPNGQDCLSTAVRLHWSADGRRFDAEPARQEDGLSAGTLCSAQVAAEALDPDQVIVEGSCENLLGRTAVSEADTPSYGPVRLSFRALCRKVTR